MAPEAAPTTAASRFKTHYFCFPFFAVNFHGKPPTALGLCVCLWVGCGFDLKTLAGESRSEQLWPDRRKRWAKNQSTIKFIFPNSSPRFCSTFHSFRSPFGVELFEGRAKTKKKCMLQNEWRKFRV